MSEQELQNGSSSRDIKESFAYYAKRDLIIFGNQEGLLSFLERKSGRAVGSFKAEFGFYSTPLVYKNTIIATSVDKHVYCIDLDTYAEKWHWHAGARIFSSPTIIGERLYVGANTGRFTELEPETGKELSSFLVTERITNKVAYNPRTEYFFLPTFANELYCLKKNSTSVE